MANLFNKLSGWKTYITATIAMLTALLGYLNHTLTGTELIAALFAAIQTMNVRHALTTTATSTAVQAGNPAAKITGVLFALLLLGASSSMAQTTETNPSASPVSISGIFNQLPGLKQGAAYDIASGNASYFTTTDLLSYAGFSLSAGYATSSAIVGSIDYDIGGLARLGLNVPLLSAVDLRVGFMVGMSDISTTSSSGSAERNKLVYGPEVTIVSLKF